MLFFIRCDLFVIELLAIIVTQPVPRLSLSGRGNFGIVSLPGHRLEVLAFGRSVAEFVFDAFELDIGEED